MDLLKPIEHFYTASTSSSLLVVATPQGVNIYPKCTWQVWAWIPKSLKSLVLLQKAIRQQGASSYAGSKTSPGALFVLRKVGELLSNRQGSAPGHTHRATSAAALQMFGVFSSYSTWSYNEDGLFPSGLMPHFSNAASADMLCLLGFSYPSGSV